MFSVYYLTLILSILYANIQLINCSDIKCYSCYKTTCPQPWNPNPIDKVTSPSGWCLTFSTDNQTSESTYARNWASSDMCRENKCEWRTNSTGAFFYICCCNTNLCNGIDRDITTTPSNSHMKFMSNIYCIFTIAFAFIIIKK